MAQRLEAALRKPNCAKRAPAGTAPPSAQPRAAAAPTRTAAGAATTAAPARARPSAKPARSAPAKPNQSKTTLYDSLEQEMASLLGRPTKT